MPGKFNWPLTVYALHLRLTLLGKSLWIILTYLNCLYTPLPTCMCISHAVKHTDTSPLCILAATCNFKGPHVHLFIRHGINNLYPWDVATGEKNNQWQNMQNAARMASRRETPGVIPALSNAQEYDWGEVKYFTVREQRKAQFISISCVLGQWQFNTIPVGV